MMSTTVIREVKDLEKVVFDMDSTLVFRVVDELDHYVSKYSFICESQGRGQRKKWHYFTESGYSSGEQMYKRYPVELITYLSRMNSYLGQSHSFQAVIVDRKELDFKNNQHYWEVLDVTRYNTVKPRVDYNQF